MLTGGGGVVAEVQQGEPQGVIGVAQVREGRAGGERGGAAVEHRLAGRTFESGITGPPLDEAGGA